VRAMIDVQSRGAARVISRALMYIVLLVAALLAVLPFDWTVPGSLMPPVELYSQTPHLWPAHPDFSSYTRIFELVPMGRYFFNSLLTSAVTMVVATLVSSAAGYTFAQLRFIGSRIWFVLIIATLMVPYQSRVIPLFVMFTQYGLFNSYAGIVLPGLASAFGLFMMTQFFKSIPTELREAALMDGAGELRIFFQIYLPLARPAV